MRRSPRSYPRPLTARECATLERMARGMTQKMIAFEFGIFVNTVGNIAANAYRRLGVHSAAAAVHAHRDAHFLCGSSIDSGRSVRASLRTGRRDHDQGGVACGPSLERQVTHENGRRPVLEGAPAAPPGLPCAAQPRRAPTPASKADARASRPVGVDPGKVARYRAGDVARLMRDAAIVRNRAKIAVAIANANANLETKRDFGMFHAYQ